MQWGMSNFNYITGILAKQQGLPYITMDGPGGAPQYRIDDPKTLAWYQKVADFVNVQHCQPNAEQQLAGRQRSIPRRPYRDGLQRQLGLR